MTIPPIEKFGRVIKPRLQGLEIGEKITVQFILFKWWFNAR